MSYPRLASLTTPGALRGRLDELGISLPLHDVVEPDGVLASPVTFTDGSAGTFTVANRFCALPMEGWDGAEVGTPTDLVRHRWERIGASGCGLVWAEATAVRPDGRANPNQLVIGKELGSLRELIAPEQIVGLQLTHSGRYCRPSPPRIAYRHPILDARANLDDTALLSDDELDTLARDYVDAAAIARDAGFAFVDIKHCHGYLLHELLSARSRPGRYGGDLDRRTRFLRTAATAIRDRLGDLAIAVRVSIFDLVPFRMGADRVGEPEAGYEFAFGGDATGLGIDLTETHRFLEVVAELGIGLVCTTAGSPYYNPHIQRPAFFPPSDGYLPPEDPLVGVARQLEATAEVAAEHPDLTIVGSGYSYLQEWVPNVAQAVVSDGGASIVGLGRMMLAYPTLAADVLAGRTLERKSICRTFSDCTTAPRNGLVSGCYPLDPFYKERPERTRLLEAKTNLRIR